MSWRAGAGPGRWRFPRTFLTLLRNPISWPVVPVRVSAVAAALVALAAAACGSPLGSKYEYQEQLYLRVDGKATVVIDASIPALVALRGVTLDPDAPASTDRAALRRMFEAAGCHVDNVGQPWRRNGRRFIQVRLSTRDVRGLSECGLLAWSAYALDTVDDDNLRFRQTVGKPAAAAPGKVKWTGSEVVAFRVHVPSRIREHNVRRLDADRPGDIERGNILTWQQRLADRLAGKPVVMDVRMDADSILFTTLWLFGGAFVAAVSALAGVVWLVVRRGRKQAAARQS